MRREIAIRIFLFAGVFWCFLFFSFCFNLPQNSFSFPSTDVADEFSFSLSWTRKLFGTSINFGIRVNILLTLADTSYMGRIFLAPRSETRGVTDQNLIYVNIGWVTKGNQKFPPYQADIMGSTISLHQYQKLEADITSYRLYPIYGNTGFQN